MTYERKYRVTASPVATTARRLMDELAPLAGA